MKILDRILGKRNPIKPCQFCGRPAKDEAEMLHHMKLWHGPDSTWSEVHDDPNVYEWSLSR